MNENPFSRHGGAVPATDQLLFTAAPDTPSLAAGVLTVDLKLLRDNWRMLALEASPAQCAATLKADAYGVGLEPCARALHDAGCRTFFVALPGEGAALRTVLPDVDIFVLDGVFPGEAAFYHAHGLIPVLNSLEEIEEWSALCAKLEARLPAAIHVDTGIHRLGLGVRDVERLAANNGHLAGIDLRLVISHLACADNPGDPMNERQRLRFERLRALLPPAPASLANSPGAFLGRQFAYDMIRPGVALYGGNPFANRSNPMAPVVHLYGRILQVHDIAKNESVGYGATWRAERAGRIATIGIGYRDGYPRAVGTSSGDGPQVMIAGKFAPLVGRVSMDLICIDVTDISPEFARRGGHVELIGDNITIDDVARWAGTIPYEILTRLGTRFTRLYSSGDSI